MITLHILKLLANEGFGTIDTDLFWEEAPLNSSGNPKDGVWIVPRGAEVSRFDVGTQAFDVYSRYANKVTSSKKLEDILEYLQTAFDEVCELPTMPPYSTARYYDVMIMPTSGIENVGTDEQDKVVRVVSGQVKFKKES